MIEMLHNPKGLCNTVRHLLKPIFYIFRELNLIASRNAETEEKHPKVTFCWSETDRGSIPVLG